MSLPISKTPSNPQHLSTHLYHNRSFQRLITAWYDRGFILVTATCLSGFRGQGSGCTHRSGVAVYGYGSCGWANGRMTWCLRREVFLRYFDLFGNCLLVAVSRCLWSGCFFNRSGAWNAGLVGKVDLDAFYRTIL